MESFDNNILFEILIKSDPLSVFQLCNTNVKFRNLCSQQIIFHRLMSIHFPQFPIDINNPKQQYKNIVGCKGVEYYILFHYDIPEQITITLDGEEIDFQLLESVDKVAKRMRYWQDEEYDAISTTMSKFTILGTEILRNVYLLIYAYSRGGRPFEFDCRVYKNIEDAVEDFINTNYDKFLHKWLIDFSNAIADDENLSDVLKQRYLPNDFSKDGIRNYMILNKYFCLGGEDVDSPYWRIVNITLQ